MEKGIICLLRWVLVKLLSLELVILLYSTLGPRIYRVCYQQVQASHKTQLSVHALDKLLGDISVLASFEYQQSPWRPLGRSDVFFKLLHVLGLRLPGPLLSCYCRFVALCREI